MEHDLSYIAGQFHIAGKPIDLTATTAGHINDTYILTAKEDGHVARYVLQRINQNVFKDPPRMMANIMRVTEHIRARTRQVDRALASRQLVLIGTDNGAGYYEDAGGNFWRMYNFVDSAATYDTLESTQPAYEAARTFGWFQRMLLDLPGPPLHETILGFHDTMRRLEVFQQVTKADVCRRVKAARREIDFVFENATICSILSELVRRGDVPVRIAHNDAKINNVMLDRDTGKGVCVIDLDTVMPGLSLHDFGDLVRTATCSAAEDERDLSKVAVNLSLFDALVRGFVEQTGSFLTPAERKHMVLAGKVITFEQLIRFLGDYLAGDVYYKVRREGHNLDRARTQMKLIQSIAEQEEAMNGLVERALQEPPGPTI